MFLLRFPRNQVQDLGSRFSNGKSCKNSTSCLNFDEKLNRIGYGKGYYDRILQKINKIKKKTISLGIAYSFQKCRKIPANKHDFRLDYIFTERGIISSNQ